MINQTKKMKNFEALNIYNYVNRQENNKYPMLDLLNKLNVKVKWAFRANFKKIEDIVKLYNDVLKDLQNEYSDDIHSVESTETDENGNESKIRTVKDEYMKDYQDKVRELLDQENEISVKIINIEDIENTDLNFTDLEILSFMINESE